VAWHAMLLLAVTEPSLMASDWQRLWQSLAQPAESASLAESLGGWMVVGTSA